MTARLAYSAAMALPVEPPIEPMLCKAAPALPDGDGWLFEPKWDGFRALVFRDGDRLVIQSRDGKPLERYFPEVVAALAPQLPPRVVLDGELVIATGSALDFEALLTRIHPAASRVATLAAAHPASYVAWDLLALGDDDLRARPQVERRAALEVALAGARPPLLVTPVTRDRAVAADWFARFEGAGLDGVIAKPADLPYRAGQRAMVKIKHARTADCAVAGFRWYKDAPGELVGSLLLGLHDRDGQLHHVGITATFTRAMRAQLAVELAPLVCDVAQHPWAAWQPPADEARRPGMTSRWNRGKDLGWVPVRVERVCEVGYDHLQGARFRHATQWKRWRPDRAPASCAYDQLEVVAPAELAALFAPR